MTTIAYSWPHRMLAADRQVTGGSCVVGGMTKIRKVGSLLMAFVGAMPLCSRWQNWVLDGLEGECPPMDNGKDKDNLLSATGIIFLEDRVIEFMESGVQTLRAPYCTYGSGGEFALGVLAHGGSPIEAVEAAIRHDVYSGVGMDVIRF